MKVYCPDWLCSRRPKTISIPSFGASRNGTLPRGRKPFTITNDASILRRIITYNKKAADNIVSYYNDASSQTNTVVSSWAAASTDILPFCVGLAKNPVRARIFRNKMTCDINGFRTPFIFIAHTKKDARHAAYPICSGLTPPPLSSSMIFSGISTCAIREFKTDISFFESGSKGTNFDVDGLHESMTVW
ncbi:hypothetical protein BGX33_012232 [Mortierella sp. NVP41]|nr:hypothetical protein BGX33_012232 [Mortierella sp. NVP41]